MKRIRVNYYFEPEGWTAETPDRPQWTAFGETLQEVRELAREGLPLAFGEAVDLFERFPVTGNIFVLPTMQISGVTKSGPPATPITASDLLPVP
jgi:predicted RNase H-like HicB family nuclease